MPGSVPIVVNVVLGVPDSDSEPDVPGVPGPVPVPTDIAPGVHGGVPAAIAFVPGVPGVHGVEGVSCVAGVLDMPGMHDVSF